MGMTNVRRIGATSAATLSGVAVAVILTSLAAPKWTQAAGLDVWNLPTLQIQIETSARNDLAMNAEIEDNRNRLAMKTLLIDELVAQRTNLKEVTEQFLILNQNRQSTTFAIRASYSGATDEEKTARNVIALAGMRLTCSFVEKVKMLARLTVELRNLTVDHAVEMH
jgi:hypothetical protein